MTPAIFFTTPATSGAQSSNIRLASLVRFTHPPGVKTPRVSVLPAGWCETGIYDEELGRRMSAVPRLIEQRLDWTLYWTDHRAGWAVRHADTTTFAIW